MTTVKMQEVQQQSLASHAPAILCCPFGRDVIQVPTVTVPQGVTAILQNKARLQLQRKPSTYTSNEWTERMVSSYMNALIQSRAREEVLMRRLRKVDAGHRGCYIMYKRYRKDAQDRAQRERRVRAALKKLS
jgi:hypothetical protein